jgi:uncharacterized protein
MGRYVHFEYYVDDAQKAMDFYEKVFDWKAEQFGGMPYWMVKSGPDDQPGVTAASVRARHRTVRWWSTPSG